MECNNTQPLNITIGNQSLAEVPPLRIDTLTIFMVLMFGLICVVGLVGNGLVVFVILRYTKMKTVTNMYILNLSIADALFLVGLPMIMSTAIVKQWIFGYAMCKIFFILTCINTFTGAFTLMVMSGDRFLAVCFPISSMQYRTAPWASLAITFTWVISFLLMIPIIIYTKLRHPDKCNAPEKQSCTVVFPEDLGILPSHAFTLYTLILGFLVPVVIIIVLYSLLLLKLRRTGPQNVRSAEKRRSHRKVTKLVTLIIIVYIVCWLPYWAFQIHLITRSAHVRLAEWKVYMYSALTILSYTNSMVNPCLYAFTNENFRESFINAFRCAGDPIVSGRRPSEIGSHVANNNGALKSKKLKDVNRTQYEFTTLTPVGSQEQHLNH